MTDIAAKSRAPFVLRIAGWIVSLSGAALLVFSGGFTPETKYYFMTGAIVMVIGMILTSSSGLVAHLQRMRSLRKPSEPPQASPPAPPAPQG